ncbi:universal stress protein [Halogeometricum borinquense]|uniref:Universal stress protein UspA-like protein n=2 Tax=Halogeometricum borinquense TaxID=60847 RepID=E4NQ89_HALBP|nr:universal stress protein [Halogeometricum borinquense]ADQ66651.1 universal stress protein UspA-like protein [Halogeometricum borinquense DSM 11551]ELY30758.1 universal stress protein uspa-like protein [Halogeometricum borinquense DSM 11551]QIB75031.1 universal stress protein [Halogeometricum borinquense]QIQ75988.1 universal stress protein [Halogeometricum borinquense]RYJ14498.1 universal stress protein [Halogeometricum borinquense]
MTTYVLATNHVDTSAVLCDYLLPRLGANDIVHAVNSLPGGDDTTSEDVRDGEDALNVVDSRLGGFADVETHQFVRGNDADEDILSYVEEVDADELVIGVRKRNPTAKVVFGSTAQRILLNSNVPMAVVPLERVD